jgi:colicin import membrane protein
VGELRQESLLFSLRVLEELEKDRVRAEQAERTARAEAERAALMEDEQRRREAEARRAHAELARQREEELRLAEEQARMEAMQQALVERARIEAEWRGRAAIESQHREHEARLAALTGAARRQRMRALLLVLAAVSMACAVGAATLVQRLRHTEGVTQAQRDTLELERQSRSQTSRLLELSERRASAIAAELETARRAQGVVPAPAAPVIQRTAPGRSAPAPQIKPGPSRRPCKNDGDPMDDCL